MTEKFWQVPIMAAYIYVITILANAGYVSYFGVPPHFVGTSIRENVLFVDMLFTAAWQSAAGIGFLWLILLPLAYYCPFHMKKYISIIVVILLVSFAIFWARPLGGFIAKTQVTFLTPSDNCEEFKGKTYAIPTASESIFVLLEVDSNKKVVGGFKLVDVSSLSCGLEYKDLGPLIK